ncbi:MAG: hypothetical protein QG573_2379, partial [Acidobacteriota bacterium]|nr:hypothetical protein [Acidobacteriota bacterium]
GQWLFRAEVSGEQGSGSLRLLLRRFAAERFALAATDALGQARWEIRRDRDEAIWLDSQTHAFCRLDPRQPLRASQWVPNISLENLPGLLIGEWPSASAVSAVGAPTGTTGQRITGERGEGGWSSWTLWEAGEPVAWFQHRGAESLLSVRRPSVQVRWRVSAQGALGPAAVESAEAAFRFPGELVPSAREITCPENAIP